MDVFRSPPRAEKMMTSSRESQRLACHRATLSLSLVYRTSTTMDDAIPGRRMVWCYLFKMYGRWGRIQVMTVEICKSCRDINPNVCVFFKSIMSIISHCAFLYKGKAKCFSNATYPSFLVKPTLLLCPVMSFTSKIFSSFSNSD